MPGFGYFDACEYEPKPDNTAWIVENKLPKKSFGFVAGPAKGNASPFGGKSVYERKMALCILTGEDFFGHKVLERGKVMFVNLDEDQDKQVRLYYRMTKGKKIPGYLISRAKSCRLPEQIKLLEEDIKEAKPLVVIIDPLQRTMGGKKIEAQSDVGPIIDELKRIVRTYDCTIILNHHSNKSPDRNKESTASWLNGSGDLDAAWDFCICIEYEKKGHSMHLRNFQKEKAMTHMYYEAELVGKDKDEIIDLYLVPNDIAENQNAREFYRAIRSYPDLSVQELSEKASISRRSAHYYLANVQTIKNAFAQRGLTIDNIEDSVRNDLVE